ncbi:serine protein kinase [Xylaria sp. FL1777]|nr:serine protein kinase [Xylaria sp. FL1777]
MSSPSSSLPPTPPSRSPTPREWRFTPITLPCEWIESYRPGGYHPVHFGDVFDNGRYKVIRKLGEGCYSTVWLARDNWEERYVALKILVSDPVGSTDETRILDHLSWVAPVQAARHVTQLLDSFEHTGPNGTHKCLVFEPMGPNVNTMVEELPQFKSRMFGMDVRYPPQMARSILKQSLQALAFLHEHGIAHGDFQPGNILFALDDIDSKTEDLLRQEEPAEANFFFTPVHRVDGKRDLWSPRYLCTGEPLADFTNHTNDIQIKLSDMGGAYFFKDPPMKPLVPAGLRAPELILTGAFNRTFDIWSFGCILFELITGRPLFCTPWSESQVDRDDDLLLDMTLYLGPLPEELYKHWKTSSLYFTPERELWNCIPGGTKEGQEPLVLEKRSMEDLFDQAQPDLDEDEANQIKSLIRSILQYDPAERPSAVEILQHPWFSRDDIENKS